jgi:hypothetical protein
MGPDLERYGLAVGRSLLRGALFSPSGTCGPR